LGPQAHAPYPPHPLLQGLDFVWSSDSNEFAIRESPSVVKLYRNFQVGFAKPVFFVIVVWVQYAVRTVIP